MSESKFNLPAATYALPTATTISRDDIIRMAKEAGFKPRHNAPREWWMLTEDIERFAALVAEAERKRLTDAEQKCVVLNCTNHKSEGKFQGDLCIPCYVFVSTGKGVYSQAYRNTQRKPLTDEEIGDAYYKWDKTPGASMADFARAIESAHGIGEKR